MSRDDVSSGCSSCATPEPRSFGSGARCSRRCCRSTCGFATPGIGGPTAAGEPLIRTPVSGERAHPDRIRWAVAATFLVALTAAIYGEVGSFDFIGLDDLTTISGNPLVNRGLSV